MANRRQLYIRVGTSTELLKNRMHELTGEDMPAGGDRHVTVEIAVAARGWLAARGHAVAVLSDVVIGNVVHRLQYTNNNHWADASADVIDDSDDLTSPLFICG